jgi:hypothetical protein
VIHFARRFLSHQHVYPFDTGGSDVPGPDPNIGAAALKNAQLGQQAFDWYKQQYDAGAADRQKVSDLSAQVSQAQLDAMKQQTTLASEADQRNKATFQPVEDKLVGDAMSFDGEAEGRRLASEGTANVRNQFQVARTNLGSSLAQAGVDSGSAKGLALMGDLDLSEAAATAGAISKGQTQGRELARSRLYDAAALGRNLPAQSTTSTQLALNAGSSAVNTAQVPGANSRADSTLVGAGYSAATSGNRDYMNGLVSSTQLAQNSASAGASNTNGLLGGIGSLASAAGYIWSDKDRKRDIDDLPDDELVQAAKDLRSPRWRYDDETADRGSLMHVGPMAQDMKKRFGIGTGKQMPIQDVAGLSLAMVGALARRIEAGEKGKRA